MVEVLLLYLSSVCMSYMIDKINYHRVLYEVNKQGRYVIPELFNVAYKATYETSALEMLIPFYNIMKPMYNGICFPNTFEKFYEILDEANILESMEPERERELEATPTLAKSKELTKRHEKEIHDFSRIIFNDYSIIYFDVTEKGFSKIKRVIGPIAREDGFTQFRRLEHAIALYQALLEVLFKDKLSEEEMDEFLNIQFNFDLSDVDEKISVEEFRQGALKNLEETKSLKLVEKETETLKRELKK